MKRAGSIIVVLVLFLLAQAARADWEPAKRITWNSGYSDSPVIAADSLKNIHVVWDDDTPGNYEIYYKNSTDGGSTWSAAKRLTWTSKDSLDPVIAIDASDVVHVAWYDKTPGDPEIYYRRSEDGGATWSAVKRLTWNSGSSAHPDIAADANGTIHVVWHDATPGNAEIYYKRSGDGGTTWSGVKRLTWNLGESHHPAAAVVSTDNLHVVWRDDTPGDEEIYYRRSEDGGETWSAVKRLTWTSGISRSPDIAINSINHIHVVWQDYTPGNMEIYHKKSTDGGASWGVVKRLTWNTGDSFSPVAAVGPDDDIHISWFDNTPGNWEIFYKKSTDGGGSWSAIQRMSWTSKMSNGPALAVDIANIIHLVWSDSMSDDTEIYYKTGQ